MQRTWEATIRVKGGSQEKVTVQATSQTNAKNLIETQYGKGCIITGPRQK